MTGVLIIPFELKGRISQSLKWYIHHFNLISMTNVYQRATNRKAALLGNNARQGHAIMFDSNKLVCFHGLFPPEVRPCAIVFTSLLEYERVYLPVCQVADTPFHIQENNSIKHQTFTQC